MCAGAIVLARVPRIVFGASDPKAGAAGSVLDVLDEPALNHRPQVQSGLLARTAPTCCGRSSPRAGEARSRLTPCRFAYPGEVAERLNAPVSKTGMGGFVHRGFESLPLRCLRRNSRIHREFRPFAGRHAPPLGWVNAGQPGPLPRGRLSPQLSPQRPLAGPQLAATRWRPGVAKVGPRQENGDEIHDRARGAWAQDLP